MRNIFESSASYILLKLKDFHIKYSDIIFLGIIMYYFRYFFS